MLVLCMNFLAPYKDKKRRREKDKVTKMEKENKDLKAYVLVAADGATTALIEERISPDIVVTDLDGNLDDILLANLRGANIVVHAHGDNLEQIIKFTSFFNNVLGTTQAQPVGNVYNFGGFTDGDRAIFLAKLLWLVWISEIL